jgi:uncharacterized membrane protein
MARLRAITEIERPATDVFAFITDVEREPDWRDGVVRITIENGRPGAVGLVYTEQISRMGVDLTMSVEITEVEADRRVAYRFTGGPVKGKGSYEFAGNGDKCTVTASIDLGRGVMAKALGAMMDSQLENDLQQLKIVVEA